MAAAAAGAAAGGTTRTSNEPICNVGVARVIAGGVVGEWGGGAGGEMTASDLLEAIRSAGAGESISRGGTAVAPKVFGGGRYPSDTGADGVG